MNYIFMTFKAFPDHFSRFGKLYHEPAILNQKSFLIHIKIIIILAFLYELNIHSVNNKIWNGSQIAHNQFLKP